MIQITLAQFYTYIHLLINIDDDDLMICINYKEEKNGQRFFPSSVLLYFY